MNPADVCCLGQWKPYGPLLLHLLPGASVNTADIWMYAIQQQRQEKAAVASISMVLYTEHICFVHLRLLFTITILTVFPSTLSSCFEDMYGAPFSVLLSFSGPHRCKLEQYFLALCKLLFQDKRQL